MADSCRGVVVSRLEDAAKVLDEMAADDEGCALNSYGDGRKFWLKERDRHMAQAALLRAIDDAWGSGIDAKGVHTAALALADTLLPTEGTKP